eukprot:TRINITY_DN78079_c0_g1_i1.p2 TRINITY_DN78079_c0_g1~~TRINITY_DN78079_c0_g1_i1.p2  ORF type:complete len:129 (+),score=25.64 TRINITY_DN78079_c0_g1_i1:63-449(+)
MVAFRTLALLASLRSFGDAIDVGTDSCVASEESEELPMVSSSMVQGVPPRRICKGKKPEDDETCAKEDWRMCHKRPACTVSREREFADTTGICVGDTGAHEEACRQRRNEKDCKKNKHCDWEPKKPEE